LRVEWIAPVLFEEKRLAQSKELAEAIVLLAFDRLPTSHVASFAVDGERWRDREEKFG